MVLDGEPFELPNRRLVSRALDNRVGSYVALEVARLVAEAGAPPGDVVAGALTQEEIGGFAARAGMTGLRPDVVIVFDVTSTNDVPGADPARGRRAPARQRAGHPARPHDESRRCGPAR
jgi:endoglucanase